MVNVRLIAAFAAGVSLAACASVDAGRAPVEEAAPPPVAEQPVEQQVPSGANVLEVARGAGQFTTLVRAIEAAELAQVLAGPGPYTVFAPTDAAFAALPQGTMDQLLLPENKAKLQTVLLYHVVPGALPAAQIPAGISDRKTANGLVLQLSNQSGTVTVSGGRVINADVQAANGVIHVVDRVLIPSR